MKIAKEIYRYLYFQKGAETSYQPFQTIVSDILGLFGEGVIVDNKSSTTRVKQHTYFFDSRNNFYFSNLQYRYITKRVLDFSDNYNFISENQLSFREVMSTEDSIANVIGNVFRTLYENETALCTFVD